MAPKKGRGNKKGKQPAKTVQAKRPAIELSESEDESEQDQRIISEQLKAFERVQGLSPGGVVLAVSGAWGWITREMAQNQFKAQIRNRLTCLAQSKGVSTDVDEVGSAGRPLQPGPYRLEEEASGPVVPSTIPHPGQVGGELNATHTPGVLWPWGPGEHPAPQVSPQGLSSTLTEAGDTKHPMLQPAFLTQLISAVVAGVVPLTRGAASQLAKASAGPSGQGASQRLYSPLRPPACHGSLVVEVQRGLVPLG